MVTMTSADKALKSLYLGVVTEQLNTGINPFLAKIKMSSSDVWGKEIRKVAQYGINGGIGAGTEEYQLTGKNCAQVTACALRTRTRYSVVVSTSATGGTFKLMGRACCSPDNSLASIDGTAPAAAPAEGGA